MEIKGGGSYINGTRMSSIFQILTGVMPTSIYYTKHRGSINTCLCLYPQGPDTIAIEKVLTPSPSWGLGMPVYGISRLSELNRGKGLEWKREPARPSVLPVLDWKPQMFL